MQKPYLQEYDPPYTPLSVIKEAARCLLCFDAPCSKGCPAHTQPDRFIRAVHFRNVKGAAEIIRENNALGAVCARVCPTEKLCQQACVRGAIDKPIDIGKIQRFVTDFEQSVGMQILKPGVGNRGKVAIVGSGPAGLQASATLNRLGYAVDVYEQAEQCGGWLRYGIPEFRLPTHIVDQEIDYIKQLGVKFITQCEVGRQISLAELKTEYQAVLLTVGLSYGSHLPLFDANPYVTIAVDFLSQTKQTKGEIVVPKRALIIGGGDVAMDVVTTLKTLGCEQVTCVAREKWCDFLASQHELEVARAMNVSILDGFTPVAVRDNEVEFEQVDHGGRLTLSADKIILAVGQHSQLDNLGTLAHEKGIITTQGYQTSDPKIFAAGDVVQGSKIVVYAVKTGKEAAQAIDHFLQGDK